MSLKRFYFDRNIEICATCMFIDEYALSVHDDGEVPHGYDGTAVCCKFDDNQKESVENRLWISPCWKACGKYKRCTERQADYLDIFDEVTQTIIENPNDISKIENKIPQGSGIKDCEGNVVAHSMKRQYNKSLVSSGTNPI